MIAEPSLRPWPQAHYVASRAVKSIYSAVFFYGAQLIQAALSARCPLATWPLAPVPPGACPALGLPWACSKEQCRPAMPLGVAWPRVLSATPSPPQPQRAHRPPREMRGIAARTHSPSLGRVNLGYYPAPSRARRARSWPAPPFAHRAQQGSLHQARRSWALSFNPGALEARNGCGARPQKVRALCPRAGALSWACALSRAPLRRPGPDGPTGRCARVLGPEPVQRPWQPQRPALGGGLRGQSCSSGLELSGLLPSSSS